MPLVVAPSQNIVSFADAIRALRLSVDGWALHHERVRSFAGQADDDDSPDPRPTAGGSLRGSALRSAVANALGGRPDHRAPRAVYTIVEWEAGFALGVATWSHAHSVLDGMVELWARRPVHFSSALDPVVAAIAVSCAGVRPGDALLDPCCGSGTVLLAALAAGADACGLDASPHMAAVARRNLDAAGYPTQGGGALRRWAAAADADGGAGRGGGWGAGRGGACMVGQHDMREDWGAWGLGGLRRVRAVVANLPHGNNLRLPYDGYIRDMLRSLRAGMLGPPGAVAACRARFVFVGGARLHVAVHDADGGNNRDLRAALEEAGFEV